MQETVNDPDDSILGWALLKKFPLSILKYDNKSLTSPYIFETASRYSFRVLSGLSVFLSTYFVESGRSPIDCAFELWFVPSFQYSMFPWIFEVDSLARVTAWFEVVKVNAGQLAKTVLVYRRQFFDSFWLHHWLYLQKAYQVPTTKRIKINVFDTSVGDGGHPSLASVSIKHREAHHCAGQSGISARRTVKLWSNAIGKGKRLSTSFLSPPPPFCCRVNHVEFWVLTLSRFPTPPTPSTGQPWKTSLSRVRNSWPLTWQFCWEEIRFQKSWKNSTL